MFGPDAGAAKSFDIAVGTPTSQMALGETKSFPVTVTSANGYSGNVTLNVTGAPTSWNVRFVPSATVTVSNGVPGNVTLMVSIATTSDAKPYPLAIAGAGGAGGDARALMLDVQNEVLIGIPMGAKDMGAMAFGNGPTTVRFIAPGTKVTFINNDVDPHRIHGDGATATAGLAHQPANMAQGGKYTVTMIQTGTFPYRCHVHPAMTGTLIVANVQ